MKKDEEEKGNVVEDFFKTKRGVAIIKLSGFAIFFFFLSLLSKYVVSNQPQTENRYSNSTSSSSSSSSSSSAKLDRSLSDMKYDFNLKNYSVSSEILIGEVEYKIISLKYGDRITGIYNKGEISKQFKIEKDNVYEIINDKETLDNSFFSELNESLIDGQKVLDLTNNSEPIISVNDQNKIFSYFVDEYKIKIFTKQNIEKIQINFIKDGISNEYLLNYYY